MPSAPTTWRRRPSRKPVGEYIVWSDTDRSARLLSTWLADWHTPDAARLSLLHKRRWTPDALAEKIGHRCPVCTSVRNDRFDRPVDVTILRQTYGGNPLTANQLRNVRLTLPLASIPAVIRVETLDLLGRYLDDAWLVGDVYLETGERLAGFRSVVDRRSIPLRTKYTREWFKRSGSARFRECPRCRGFDRHLTMGGSYILAPEIPPPTGPHPAIRLDRGTICVERSIADALRLSDRKLWPGGSSFRVPVYDERLDPIPSLYPRTWADLVRGIAENGDFPFDELGRWTAKLKKEVGANPRVPAKTPRR